MRLLTLLTVPVCLGLLASCGGGGSGDSDRDNLVVPVVPTLADDLVPQLTPEPEPEVVQDPVLQPVTPTGFIESVRVGNAEGVFYAGAPPSETGGVVVDPFPAGEESVDFISGGSVLLPVDSAVAFSTVYVASDDEGYFVIDLPVETNEAELVVSYSPIQLDGETGGIGVQVGTPTGDISSTTTQGVNAIVVGTGEVQVSVSWDTPTDVDIHLTEPDGTQIDWFSEVSPSGGMLDLDSNPGCSIDGVNNENISYEGATPPSGEYTLELNYFSDCDISGPTNYVVTVRAGGQTRTYTGSFVAADVFNFRTITTFIVP